jgi:hypothetical protein
MIDAICNPLIMNDVIKEELEKRLIIFGYWEYNEDDFDIFQNRYYDSD